MTYKPFLRRGFACALALSFFAACGGGSGDDQPTELCGNGVIDGLERCDDGNDNNDDECNNECEFSCGDGTLQPAELCDPGIAAGSEGACPTECDDGMACTDNNLVGADCQVQCEYPDIDFFRDGDGCCPDVADNNAFNDFDCMSTCGNGVVEMGETCDTAITAGEVGSCPDLAYCSDGAACTTDAVVVPEDNMPGDGACRAYCEWTEITAVADGDSCCPAGATDATDIDCVSSTFCGNGAYNPGQGETCDTAITMGNGLCPTSCDAPSDPCLSNTLVSEGTCSAECIETEIKQPINDDMCCPVFYGANNRNDNDCTSSCGTPAEECDTPGVGSCDTDCRIVRTGFRVTTIEIMDPHIYWDLENGNCPDLTSIVNSSTIPDAIKQDQDGDGFAELSWVHSFIPLDQAASTNRYELVYANCTPGDPAASVCVADPLTDRVASTATNMSTGNCLDILPDTTTGTYTTPVVPDGPCFVTDVLNIDLALGSLVVPLTEGYISASYDMDPATGLVKGMLRGFVSEASAQATVLPMSIPLLGGKLLSEILAGGIAPGACNVSEGVPIGDDRDVGPDGTTMGWYFYVNFTAVQVPFDESPNASTPPSP